MSLLAIPCICHQCSWGLAAHRLELQQSPNHSNIQLASLAKAAQGLKDATRCNAAPQCSDQFSAPSCLRVGLVESVKAQMCREHVQMSCVFPRLARLHSTAWRSMEEKPHCRNLSRKIKNIIKFKFNISELSYQLGLVGN